MIKQFSAGGIVFRKLISNNRKPQTVWLICQHSGHKGWVFPKGIIGDLIENESREETAIREVEEETGVQAEILKRLPKDIQYKYQMDGNKYFKTVYYYLMQYKSGSIEKHDEEMQEVRWAKEQEVRDTLTYENDRNAFSQALSLYTSVVNKS